MRLILSLLFLQVLTSASLAQEVPTPLRATIVSDVSMIKPGETFNLGVLFQIDPGWYIYWKDPGDSGLPTKVKISLPSNLSSGELYWPAPETIHNSSGGTDYGYKESVLLWSTIKVPSNSEINSNLKIGVETSWLSCKDICIPGEETFEYNLRVGDERESTNTNLFSEWRMRLDK